MTQFFCVFILVMLLVFVKFTFYIFPKSMCKDNHILKVVIILNISFHGFLFLPVYYRNWDKLIISRPKIQVNANVEIFKCEPL